MHKFKYSWILVVTTLLNLCYLILPVCIFAEFRYFYDYTIYFAIFLYTKQLRIIEIIENNGNNFQNNVQNDKKDSSSCQCSKQNIFFYPVKITWCFFHFDQLPNINPPIALFVADDARWASARTGRKWVSSWFDHATFWRYMTYIVAYATILLQA